MKFFSLFLVLTFLPPSYWNYDPALDKLLWEIGSRRIQIEAVEAVYELEPSGPAAQAPAGTRQTISFRAPDRLRINLSKPEREEVFLSSGAGKMAMAGDQVADIPWPQPFQLYRLLTTSRPKELKHLLILLGCNTETISYSQKDESIIIGAKEGDRRAPQVWFSGTDLVLTRLILPPSQGQMGYDITVSDYVRHTPGVDWPHRLVVLRGKDNQSIETAVMNLRSVGIDRQVETRKIDLEEIRKNALPPPRPDPALDHNPDMTDIKKMMEWLDRKLQ